jgi:hypothetical protein
MTTTYYKAFAPRIGIAWSPGSSGKTSIRAGWGLFYNPIEQLVLAQFGAEPPFGGSTTVSETQFNLPFAGQDYNPVTQLGTTYLNPFHGVISPARGTMQNWAQFEPIDLYGDFQPHLRSQYSAQYNLTVQRELTKDTKSAMWDRKGIACWQRMTSTTRTRRPASISTVFSALEPVDSSPRTLNSSSPRERFCPYPCTCRTRKTRL